VILKGTRSQGFRGSSEMLKNYKDLKVWQRRLRIQGVKDPRVQVKY